MVLFESPGLHRMFGAAEHGPEHMPEIMPRMPERMPDQMSDVMSEYMSNRMSVGGNFSNFVMFCRCSQSRPDLGGYGAPCQAEVVFLERTNSLASNDLPLRNCHLGSQVWLWPCTVSITRLPLWRLGTWP